MNLAKKMFLAAVAFGFLAMSCGGSSGKTLELWTVFTGADGTTFTKMVEAYNATNPDYKVKHVPMQEGTMYTRLQLAVSSGRGVPDMAINHVERLPLYQEEGRLVDLAPYLAQSNIKSENYIPKAWEMGEINGGHYGIPLDVHSYILYVNWDLYEKYGLSDLDDGVLTWDEVVATAQTVKDDGIIPIGLGWLRVIFLASYAQLGGTLSENGVDPSFDNDIARQAMEHYRNLVSSGITNRDGEDPWRMFLGGDVLYMPEGAWMLNNVKTAGLNTRSFDFPVFSPDAKGNWTSSHNFTVPVKPNLDPERIVASLEFINWLGEHSETWSEAGHVPAHRGGQTEVFRNMPQAFLADQNEELKIFGYKYYGHAVEALDKVVGDIFFGKMDVDEGLRQAIQETKDRIAEGS